MRRSGKNGGGRRQVDISISDLNSKSTCSKLKIPHDIACNHCKY